MIYTALNSVTDIMVTEITIMKKTMSKNNAKKIMMTILIIKMEIRHSRTHRSQSEASHV